MVVNTARNYFYQTTRNDRGGATAPHIRFGEGLIDLCRTSGVLGRCAPWYTPGTGCGGGGGLGGCAEGETGAAEERGGGEATAVH